MFRTLKQKILQKTLPYTRLETFGFDISDKTIKYLKVSPRKETVHFDFSGEIGLPDGIITNGDIQNEAELTRIIKDWTGGKDGKNVQSAFANVSLPEEKSYVRLLQLPKVKHDGIRGAVRWEMEANIPVPVDELIYDYEVVELPQSNIADTQNVLVTAFPKKIVESYVRVLQSAGINLASMELESQAIVRAISAQKGDESIKAVADVGRNRISLIVVSGGVMVFTTTIDLGGNTFDENIARALNITTAEAEKIKIEKGLRRTIYDGKIFSAITPALSVFADQIKQAVEYYHNYVKHNHEDGADISEVLLTGGNANLDGLEMYLSSILRIPVRRADPFESVRKKMTYAVPPMPKNQSLAYASAVGLALRGIV